MTAFVKLDDYIHVLTSDYRDGEDMKDCRAEVVPTSSMTFLEGMFTMPGSSTKIKSEWISDRDQSLPPHKRELRYFCLKGKVTFQFTGTNLTLRLGLNPAWGDATIRIDGQAPSAIPGVLFSQDTVTCDSDSQSSFGAEYKDFKVVDGLTDSLHTCELYCNNTSVNGSGWFVISCAKVFSYSRKTLNDTGWIMPSSYGQNARTLRFKNIGSKTFKNVTVTCPSGLLGPNDGQPFPTLSTPTLGPGQELVTTVSPYLTAVTNSGVVTRTLQITGEYEDPDGTIPYPTNYDYVRGSPNFTVSNHWWDETVLSNIPCLGATSNLAKLTITNAVGVLKVTVYRDWGYGTFKVLIDGVQFGTTWPTTNTGPDTYEYTITDLGTTPKTVVIQKAGGSELHVVKVTLTTNKMFSSQTETITLNYDVQHVPPLPVLNTRVEDHQVKFDPADVNADDPYGTTTGMPMSNIGINKTEISYRFPTFIVCYQAGFEKLIEEYDIAVIEPKAVSIQQVKRWQSLGIKVLAYVSFGEEDGVRPNIWALEDTATGPYIGNGAGPGGYAGYYMKAGYKSRERSECLHDNQALLDQKTCANANPKYLTGLGRCSNACSKDWRDGYLAWSEGGACGGGYTRSNNWQRDALKACTNSACPGYAPLNQGCSEYEQCDGWLQDFSVMTTNFPDENGIWSSYYVNPFKGAGWYERIRDHYLPIVFGEPTRHTDVQFVTEAHTTPSGVVYGFQLPDAPFDKDDNFIVKNAAGTVLVGGVDYTTDHETGVVLIQTDGITGGQTFKVSYTTLRLNADGVFMDTVDTVDIYPDPAYQDAAAQLILDMKQLYPHKLFCSNRGFTILDKTIKACEYVMFETFLSEYDWDNGQYYQITDPGTIAFNDQIHDQLKRLRETNTFDVLALNYCSNGPEGDELRQYIADTCRKYGYLSWSSTILLNQPLPIQPLTFTDGQIRSNVWKAIHAKPVS